MGGVHHLQKRVYSPLGCRGIPQWVRVILLAMQGRIEFQNQSKHGGKKMTESGRRLMSLSRGSRAIDKEAGVTAAEMEACAWALASKLLRVDERAGGAGSQASGGAGG